MTRRRFINYPTGQLLGVFGDLVSAEAAREALQQSGIAPDDIVVLHGPDAARRLDGLGAANGPLARILRSVQFMTMDQMPDFLVYETAIRNGRAVLAVRPGSDARRREATAIVAAHGAQFVNYYGRFSTEEISRWRGAEPPIPACFGASPGRSRGERLGVCGRDSREGDDHDDRDAQGNGDQREAVRGEANRLHGQVLRRFRQPG